MLRTGALKGLLRRSGGIGRSLTFVGETRSWPGMALLLRAKIMELERPFTKIGMQGVWLGGRVGCSRTTVMISFGRP